MSAKKPPGKSYPHVPGYARGSDTSKRGAEAVAHSAPNMHMKIWLLIEASGVATGMTFFEINDVINPKGSRAAHQQIKSRLTELGKAGDVEKLRIDGRKVKRKNPDSGVGCNVWIVSPNRTAASLVNKIISRSQA